MENVIMTLAAVIGFGLVFVALAIFFIGQLVSIFSTFSFI